MEDEKKQKIIIGGSIAVGVISLFSAIIIYYIKKQKEDEMSSDTPTDEYDEYERPTEVRYAKSKHFKVYSNPYKSDEREEGRFRVSGNKYGRNRFNVFQSNSSLSAVIDDPFAVPRKIGEGRFRRSGERW